MGSRLGSETARERYGGDESADGTVTILPRPYYRDESADAAVAMLFAAVGVEVLGSETTETNLRTLLLPCYLQLLGCRCWGARRRRRICGRCCYHAICSCWGAGAGERDGGDESADAAVTMLFAAVGVEVLGSETTETNLRTLLLPCYLQLLGCRCWGARRRRRICGRCCYHAVCSCWGGGAGERDGGDESADAAVAMLFAAVGVEVLGSETEETNLRTLLLLCYLQLSRCWGAADAAVTMLFAAVGALVLGSETEETNLRTLLLPCYLQLLGWRCWGARRRRRICGRCCYHAICSCWGGGAGERDGGDESADAAVAMLFAAVGVEVLGSETTETNLRTLLLPCYLQLLRCRYWGARRRRRICGRCCYHAFCSCWGGGAGERDGGDESADAAVTMLFAAASVELLGSDTEETHLRTLLFPCYLQEVPGSDTEGTNLRTLLLPCYLQLLGWRCWGARLPRRICGRCCCHAICSCWGGGAGERDYRDESADAAVTMLFAWGAGAGERDYRDESADAAVAMLFAAVGVQVPGSEMEETNLRTLLLPCYLQLLGCRCWGARRRRRICGRCCSHAICSCWGGAAGERYGGDESADAAVPMLFAAVGVEVLGSETEETNLRTLLLPCYLQLLGCRCWGARRRRRICGRCCYHAICGRCCCHAICSCWGGAAGERDGGGRRICGRCCCHAICGCWGGGAGERDYRDESADAAVAMLFAAVAVQVLGSETEETNLRTLLLPCYLQLLGWRCWGARRRRRICGRCCYHGERDGGDESADAAVTMLFAAASVELLESDTEEMHLRTLLGSETLPCYLQLLGWRCWGAIRRRRICGRCCCHAICSCWGGGAGERGGGDESADGVVAMLFAAVGRCWGARLPRRICGRCCCHAICSCWGAGAGERDGGDESADAAVTMLFADAAVPMLFAAVGVELLGSETEEGDASADAAVALLFAAVGVEVLGSETTETNLRTLLLPCYLQLLRCRYTGERDGGDESADAAVTMLFAAVGVEVLGSETEETNLRTLLLPCYLQLQAWSCWRAIRRRCICGRCCSHAICSC